MMHVPRNDKGDPVRTILLLSLSTMILACSSVERQETAKQSPPKADTQSVQPPPPPGPAAIGNNLTLIGAVIKSMESIDDDRYVAMIELRTAIPLGNGASLAEPGQTISIVPGYVLGDDGKVLTGNERNSRLRGVRSLKEGDPLMGKISMGQDGKWYLFDTKLD